jgi:hypothetical protein
VQWIDNIYTAKIVANGGIVRRGISSLPSGITEQMVIDDAHARGYNVLVAGGQIIIFCTPFLQLT